MFMDQRHNVLQEVAGLIIDLPDDRILRVGIDGVDGAGKTTFANEITPMLEKKGRTVIRASVDGFHNPRTVRYRLGRSSPEGFYLDSYDYIGLKKDLLDPLCPGGSGYYREAIFDHRSDLPISQPEKKACPRSILVFDGIFLHRPELRIEWQSPMELGVHVG
jgi:uridine kinase